MVRLLIPATVLLLAACSGPARIEPVRSAQEQACADQADQDPALKQWHSIAAGNLDWQWQHGPELAQLKQDAITRCLRARGLASRGGVERAH